MRRALVTQQAIERVAEENKRWRGDGFGSAREAEIDTHATVSGKEKESSGSVPRHLRDPTRRDSVPANMASFRPRDSVIPAEQPEREFSCPPVRAGYAAMRGW